MMKKDKVRLTAPEREELGRLISRGKGAARKRRHGRILLQADRQVGWKDQASSEALEVSIATIAGVRERLVAAG